MRRSVSSAVAETSAQLSSQSAKPKSGSSCQSNGDNGFSGLVDSSLAAAAEGEVPSPQAKPKKSASAGTAGQQGSPSTGVYKTSKGSEPTQTTASAGKAAPAEDDTAIDAKLSLETALEAVVITNGVSVESDRAASETEIDGEQATAVASSVAATATGIIPAVAIQIELAIETAPENVIASSEAITLTNPPATMVTPAEIAANALAKVAAETSDGETDVEAQAAVKVAAPGSTSTESAASVVGETAAAETKTLIEMASAEVQLEVKAKAELSGATKAVDLQNVEASQQAKIEALKIEPVSSPKEVASPQQPPVAAKAEAPAKEKAETPANQPVAAKNERPATPDRPAETETRPSQRPAQEQPVQAAAQTHTPASEQSQPSGFGLSHLSSPQTSGAGLQAASLTAIPAAGAPVPIQGLAVEIAANLQIGRSRFEVRLDPPELGRIDVRLDVDRQGQVTSHLIVEKSATLDLLRRDAQQLERALHDAGLKTSDNGLQFSLRDQQQGRNNDDGSPRDSQRLIVTEEETIAAETAGRSYGRMAGQRGGIDIRV